MAEWSQRRRRVFIEDARANGLFLRTTWHPDGRQFVVSTWNGELCTGAIRVPVDKAPELVTLLVDGLADAAEPIGAPPSPRTVDRRRLSARLETLARSLRRSGRRTA